MNNPCTHCLSAEHFKIGKTQKRSFHYCNEISVCGKYLRHKEYLLSKRKYRQGEPITSLDELLQQQFVYVFRSIRHIEVVKHLQLATILSAINRKGIYKAIKKSEE